MVYVFEMRKINAAYTAQALNGVLCGQLRGVWSGVYWLLVKKLDNTNFAHSVLRLLGYV